MACHLRAAPITDVPLILSFIRDLATCEKLPPDVIVTEAALKRTLGGNLPAAHVVSAEVGGPPAGCALSFFNHSAFGAKPDFPSRTWS